MSNVTALDLDIPESNAPQVIPDETPESEAPAPEAQAPEEPTPVELTEADDEAPSVEDEQPRKKTAQDRIHQEIERRKAIEADLESVRKQNELMEQRFGQLLEKMQAPEAPQQIPEAPVPEFDEDPAAHLLAQQQKIQEQLAQQQEYAKQQQVIAQQQAQMQQVQQRFEAMEQGYAQENPDYYPAINGLKEARLKMWQGLGLPAEQAMQRVQEEAWAVVQQGLNSGHNPAEILYAEARRQGAVPPPAPAPDPVQEVQEQAANQRRASSLGSRSGGASKPPTVSDLLSMSDEEFAKNTATYAQWKKMAGG